jgi:hypothetical protein
MRWHCTIGADLSCSANEPRRLGVVKSTKIDTDVTQLAYAAKGALT